MLCVLVVGTACISRELDGACVSLMLNFVKCSFVQGRGVLCAVLRICTVSSALHWGKSSTP
jgi:hypothetical protein